MQFENANIAAAILIVPLVMLLIRQRWAVRRRRLALFADEPLLPDVYPPMKHFRLEMWREMLYAGAAFLLLFLAVLRPQWGFTWKEGKRRGVDIMIAVDVSDSMQAKDVSPNRLERARRKVLDLLERLRGDRVGLVTFAGVPFLETPLTYDYGTFRQFVTAISPELSPVKGTNIQAAVERCIEAFDEGVEKRGSEHLVERARAVLLVSDGEEVIGEMKEMARLAEEKHVKIFVLGVGTAEGAPIGVGDGYKRDRNGAIVLSRLESDKLRELALATGGVYVQSLASDQDLQALYDQGIKRALEDTEMEGGKSKRWNEYYQVPLGLALCLLIFQPVIAALRRLRWAE